MKAVIARVTHTRGLELAVAERGFVVSARGAEDTPTGAAVMSPTREGEDHTAVLAHGHVAIGDPDWTRVPERGRGGRVLCYHNLLTVVKARFPVPVILHRTVEGLEPLISFIEIPKNINITSLVLL